MASEEPKLTVKTQYLKLARAEAAARGVIYFLNSLGLPADEKASGLIQAVGIFIANEVTNYEQFQQKLEAWSKLLARYAEINKDTVESAIKLNLAARKEKMQ